jgi:hypothetical protein
MPILPKENLRLFYDAYNLLCEIMFINLVNASLFYADEVSLCYLHVCDPRLCI